MHELDLPRGFLLAVARLFLVMTISNAGMSAWLITQTSPEQVVLALAMALATAVMSWSYYTMAAA